jgi:predicted dehydrogenase
MFDDSGPVVIKTGQTERVEAVSAPNRFRVQLDEFSDCVLTGKSPAFPPEDALANTAALAALSAAARTGTVEDVEWTR